MAELSEDRKMTIINAIVEPGQIMDGANGRFQAQAAERIDCYAKKRGKDIYDLKVGEVHSLMHAARNAFNESCK